MILVIRLKMQEITSKYVGYNEDLNAAKLLLNFSTMSERSTLNDGDRTVSNQMEIGDDVFNSNQMTKKKSIMKPHPKFRIKVGSGWTFVMTAQDSHQSSLFIFLIQGVL